MSWLDKTFIPARAALLDYQHERECVIRLCRDITDQSKRVIFALHRLPTNCQINASLQSQLLQNWQKLSIAFNALHRRYIGSASSYAHLFKGTIGNAVEELVEALSFGHYLMSGEFISFEQLTDGLKWLLLAGGYAKGVTGNGGLNSSGDREENFSNKQPYKKRRKLNDGDEYKNEETNLNKIGNKSNNSNSKIQSQEFEYCVHQILNTYNFTETTQQQLHVSQIIEQLHHDHKMTTIPFVSQTDHIMGLMDLTGELMRYAIVHLTEKDTKGINSGTTSSIAAQIATDLRQFAFNVHLMVADNSNLRIVSNSLGKKIKTLDQSLRKVENSICDVCVRGSELVGGEFGGDFDDGGHGSERF